MVQIAERVDSPAVTLRTKAIHRPSGDQTPRISVVRGPLVSRRDARRVVAVVSSSARAGQQVQRVKSNFCPSGDQSSECALTPTRRIRRPVAACSVVPRGVRDRDPPARLPAQAWGSLATP
jgi:hypothetical protein